MHILWMIIIGFIAGAIAKFLMPGKDGGGFIMTIILGIIGSILFSYIGQFIGLYSEGENAGLIGSVIGALIVLFIYRMMKR